MSNTVYKYGTQGNDYFSHYGTETYVAYGYGGNDTLDGNGNNDTLYGGDDNDYLYGRGGNDYLSGGYGDDNLYGGAGDDYLIGGSGEDYFHGGTGIDTVSYYYYSGNISASLTSDVATFSNVSYSESLISIENLTGGTGNDTLIGDDGQNTLNGYSGNDTLYGLGGDDILNGYLSGMEYDTLSGGTGSDTFVIGDSYSIFYQGLGYATITDWDSDYDYIQAQGSSSQYSMYSENWSGSSALDTAIYSGNDLIAVVQDTTDVSFSRNFVFT